jgi:hypothetical protein
MWPALMAASTPDPSPNDTHSAASSMASPWILVLVACIGLLGVLTTAGIQWWVGRRTSAALTRSSDAAKANADAAHMSAQAAK